MKTAIIVVLSLLTVSSPAWARRGSGAPRKTRTVAPRAYRPPVKVRGYTKKSGTYVAPAVRTTPNATQRDNYSSKGNVNPQTGKTGTVEPKR